MNILKEIERFIPSSSEEEIDNKAQDAKEVQSIVSWMKKKGINSVDDEKMEDILDDLHMDSDRFSALIPLVNKKLTGK